MAEEVTIWGSLTKPPAGIQRTEYSMPSRTQAKIFGPKPMAKASTFRPAPARHPIVAELVDEDGGPEQKDDPSADFQIIQNFNHQQPPRFGDHGESNG